MMWLLAVVALLTGLYCLFSPVRWMGWNPYKWAPNPGFDETKTAQSMWIVRLFGVVLVGMAVVFAVIAD